MAVRPWPEARVITQAPPSVAAFQQPPGECKVSCHNQVAVTTEIQGLAQPRLSLPWLPCTRPSSRLCLRNSHSGARGPASRRGAGAGACTQEAFPSSSQGQHGEIGVLHGCRPADLSLMGMVKAPPQLPPEQETRRSQPAWGTLKPPAPSLPDLQGGQKQSYAADPREPQSLVRSQGFSHPCCPSSVSSPAPSSSLEQTPGQLRKTCALDEVGGRRHSPLTQCAMVAGEVGYHRLLNGQAEIRTLMVQMRRLRPREGAGPLQGPTAPAGTQTGLVTHVHTLRTA